MLTICSGSSRILKNVKRGMDCILLQIFFSVLLGLPFSWRKFRGGVEFCWVGFTICLKERSLGIGISARRADWLVSWLSKAACEKCVCVADLRAVLGRLSFALTALGHLRPFLGPVYTWIAVAEVRCLCQLPTALIFIFGFLATALKTGGRLVPVGRLPAVERGSSAQMRVPRETKFGSVAGLWTIGTRRSADGLLKN